MYSIMSCEEAADLMTEFDENALTGPAWLRFRTHIMMCGCCTQKLDQMRATTGFLGALPPPPVISDEVRTDLTNTFRMWAEKLNSSSDDE